jgi:hypothetical protein
MPDAMRIYVAGPMRGYPDFNFPAFDDATEKLRALGHEVFSPAERDREVHGANVNDSKTGDLTDVPQFDLRGALAADLEWVCKYADAVVLLDGWEKSKGALAERAAAEALSYVGVKVYTIQELLNA